MVEQVKLLSLLNKVMGQNAKLRKGGTQATYFCPCGHYKRKLEILLDPPFFFHCWVCHFSGNLYSLFKRKNASQEDFNCLLDITKDVRINRKKNPKEKTVDLVLPSEFISLAIPPKSDTVFSEHMQEYRRAIGFLKKRGITMDDICRYNIGYCEEGEYRDCVLIPSYDDEGKLNYFSARHYYPSKWLKYKNAPFSKNIVGFECFINYNEPITLVEGVFDAIAVRNNAIPLFGTSLSWKLKEQLVLHGVKRINMILDTDALKEAVQAVEELWKWGFVVHMVQLPEKDPSEIGFHVMQNLIDRSKPFSFENLIQKRLQI